jgi:nucleoside-diphosphate-sugar epimerase
MSGKEAMKIVIAGGTGFVGSHLVKRLIAEGHSPTIMVRNTPQSKTPIPDEATIIVQDPSEPIEKPDLKADAIINLVGIIREFPSSGITFEKAHFDVTKNLIDLAERNNIGRFLQMSALGLGPDARTGYLKTKLKAEEYLQSSSLNWTIFRPSMIFGPGGEAIRMFARMVKYLPIVPVIGDGRYMLQPVHVDDVCTAFIKALDEDRAVGRIFEFGGPDVLTFNQILDEIGRAIGRKIVPKIHQPVGFMHFMAGLFGRCSLFPVTNEQIIMLLEDNFTDDYSMYELLNFRPRPFGQGLTEFL